MDQIGHQRWQSVGPIVRGNVFDGDVLALDKADFLQTLAESGYPVLYIGKRRTA
jgi:hypothetical protein